MTEAQKLKNHVERKINQETGMLEDVKERIADFAEDLSDKLKETGANAWEDVQERGQDAWKDVKVFVRKNPGAAIGVAFVTGLLAYALINQRRD
jgi:ElaB/YqjD/DUF883 family membrane-anchored ribosome-binding protein